MKRIILSLIILSLFFSVSSCTAKKKKLDITKIEKMTMESESSMSESVDYKLKNVLERIAVRLQDVKDPENPNIMKVAVLIFNQSQPFYSKMSEFLTDQVNMKINDGLLPIENFKLKNFLQKNDPQKLSNGIGIEKVKEELNADYAIIGSFEREEQNLKLNLKVYNIKTDQEISSISEKIDIDSEIKGYLQ